MKGGSANGFFVEGEFNFYEGGLQGRLVEKGVFKQVFKGFDISICQLFFERWIKELFLVIWLVEFSFVR